MKISIKLFFILFLLSFTINISIAKEYADGTFSTINISKIFYKEYIYPILLSENKLWFLTQLASF